MALNVEVTRRRFTVDEYARMVETGILGQDDRVELVHGEIVEKMPIGIRHTACVAWLHATFIQRLGARAVVRSAGSIRLSPHSAPEPDVVLLRWRADFYRTVGASSEDVLLAVEAADTSLRYDRTVKIPLYAAAGIPEVWVVDLDGRAVEVHRMPTAQGYRDVQRIERGGQVGPAAFPDVILPLGEILD